MTLSRCLCDLHFSLTQNENTVKHLQLYMYSKCGALQRWGHFCPRVVAISTAVKLLMKPVVTMCACVFHARENSWGFWGDTEVPLSCLENGWNTWGVDLPTLPRRTDAVSHAATESWRTNWDFILQAAKKETPCWFGKKTVPLTKAKQNCKLLFSPCSLILHGYRYGAGLIGCR